MTAFLFLRLLVPNDSVFALLIFVEHTSCLNVVNSKVGKQTKRRKDVKLLSVNKLKLTFGVKHSINHRTKSPNPHLVEEETCFNLFAPSYGLQ